MAQTPSQALIWTTLPRGVGAGTLQFSVHVAPRLDAGDAGTTDVGAYADFVDWPATVRGMQFELLRDNTVEPVAVRVTSTAPDSDAWRAVVVSGTPVDTFRFDDLSQRRIFTNGSGVISEFVRGRYRAIHDTVVAGGGGHPPATAFLGDVEDLRPIAGRRGRRILAEAVEELERQVATSRFVPVERITDADSARRTFAQFRRFHRPWIDAEPLQPYDPPRFDLHGFLTALADYPILMRQFGIVVDVEVDMPANVPPGSSQLWRIRPIWTPQHSGTTEALAGTYCVLSSDRFVASSRESVPMVRNGFLDLKFLGGRAFQPVTFDADGAAMKLINTVDTAEEELLAHTRSVALNKRLRGEGVEDLVDEPEPAASLSGLRSAGISIASADFVGSILSWLVVAAGLNSDLVARGLTRLSLYAESSLQGFRFDVKDSAGGGWLPLLLRRGHYSMPVPGRDPVVHTDEGVSSLAATTPVDEADQPNADLKIADSLMRWDGWALAAPRPGKRIGTGAEGQGSGVQEFESDSADLSAFGVGIDLEAEPASVPRLRFGHTYAVRARSVDLAGNSLAPDHPDETYATDPIPYGRFEPVPSPALLPAAPRSPGETADRLVIRSETAGDPPDETIAAAFRHVVAPRTTIQMAEAHGKLDGADGAPDPGLYITLAERDGGDLATHPDAVVDVTLDPDAGGAPHFPVERLDPPYLPDPLAKGALWRFDSGETVAVPFPQRSAWYDVEGFRVALVAGDGPPAVVTPQTGSPVLEVRVPKGHTRRVLLSCYMDDAYVDQMALWQWIDQAHPNVRRRIGEGYDWFFTPFRVVDLVHAVRQPLRPPEMVDFYAASRDSGDTDATYEFDLHHSHASSGRVEVMARWTEPVDGGPGAAAPDEHGLSVGPAVAMRVSLKALPLEEDEDVLRYRSCRHELGDTRHRVVTYRAFAATNYAEYFSETEAATLQGDAATIVEADGFKADSVQVKAMDGTVNFVEGTDYVVDHAAGSIARIADGAIPSGSQVKVRFLAGFPPIVLPTTNPADPSDLAEGSEHAVTVSVPSTSRPAAPVVESAVTAFAWERRRDGTQIDALPEVLASPPSIRGFAPELTFELPQVNESAGPAPLPPRLDDFYYSLRWGATIRLYLARPWWSSGEGELLAVLHGDALIDGEQVGTHESHLPFVTRWGQDPVHASSFGPAGWASPPYFPNAVPEHSGVEVLPGEAPRLVEGRGPLVSSHRPEYDPDRDMWRCDIDIWPDFLGDVYAPFVQLCIARYQPDSIPDAEISALVHLDPIQLPPTRWLGVNPSDGGFELVLAGPGASRGIRPEYEEYPELWLRNRVFVTVERRDSSVDDEWLQWVPEGEAIEIPGRQLVAFDRFTYTYFPRYWMWRGHIGVADTTDRRLVVEEYEEYPPDLWAGDPNPPAASRRLVYAETVEL